MSAFQARATPGQVSGEPPGAYCCAYETLLTASRQLAWLGAGIDEAARVHRGARQYGGVGARGAFAAGDARMAVDAAIDMSKHSKTKRFKSR